MDDLEAVLRKVRDRIARHRGQGIGEQDTKPPLDAARWAPALIHHDVVNAPSPESS
jgi:hypothetical protein